MLGSFAPPGWDSMRHAHLQRNLVWAAEPPTAASHDGSSLRLWLGTAEGSYRHTAQHVLSWCHAGWNCGCYPMLLNSATRSAKAFHIPIPANSIAEVEPTQSAYLHAVFTLSIEAASVCLVEPATVGQWEIIQLPCCIFASQARSQTV